jgi:vitamin B12 transporter
LITTTAYYNVKSATIKGLEWTGNVTTGPVDHHLTLQYIDPRDDETNKVLARRAKQQVKYELTGQIYDLGWNVRINIWGNAMTTPMTQQLILPYG